MKPFSIPSMSMSGRKTRRDRCLGGRSSGDFVGTSVGGGSGGSVRPTVQYTNDDMDSQIEVSG